MLSAFCSVSSSEADGAFRLVDEEGVTTSPTRPTDPRFRADPGFLGNGVGLAQGSVGAHASSAFGQEIRETAERYGVSPALVEAVIRTESAFNPWAVSRKGAQGSDAAHAADGFRAGRPRLVQPAPEHRRAACATCAISSIDIPGMSRSRWPRTTRAKAPSTSTAEFRRTPRPDSTCRRCSSGPAMAGGRRIRAARDLPLRGSRREPDLHQHPAGDGVKAPLENSEGGEAPRPNLPEDSIARAKPALERNVQKAAFREGRQDSDRPLDAGPHAWRCQARSRKRSRKPSRTNISAASRVERLSIPQRAARLPRCCSIWMKTCSSRVNTTGKSS